MTVMQGKDACNVGREVPKYAEKVVKPYIGRDALNLTPISRHWRISATKSAEKVVKPYIGKDTNCCALSS